MILSVIYFHDISTGTDLNSKAYSHTVTHGFQSQLASVRAHLAHKNMDSNCNLKISSSKKSQSECENKVVSLYIFMISYFHDDILATP